MTRRELLLGAAAGPILGTMPAQASEPVAGAYVGGMLALGWDIHLAVHVDGTASILERSPERPTINALLEGRRLSGWWMSSPQRRETVKTALRDKGLVCLV